MYFCGITVQHFYKFFIILLLRYVCISDDYELGSQYSIPFAGFFSCATGNPLALKKKTGINMIILFQSKIFGAASDTEHAICQFDRK